MDEASARTVSIPQGYVGMMAHPLEMVLIPQDGGEILLTALRIGIFQVFKFRSKGEYLVTTQTE